MAAAQAVAVVGGDDHEVAVEIEGIEIGRELAIAARDGLVVLRGGGAELVAGLVDV